jgi:CBS domain-containing protein
MLKTRTVSFVMTADNLLTVDVSDPLDRVYRIMRDHPVHHVPVLERGKLVGIISSSDLLRHRAVSGDSNRTFEPSFADETTAREVMETSLVTVRPRDPLLKAAQLLIKESFSSIMVVDDFGELVGILTIRDLLRHLVENDVGT